MMLLRSIFGIRIAGSTKIWILLIHVMIGYCSASARTEAQTITYLKPDVLKLKPLVTHLDPIDELSTSDFTNGGTGSSTCNSNVTFSGSSNGSGPNAKFKAAGGRLRKLKRNGNRNVKQLKDSGFGAGISPDEQKEQLAMNQPFIDFTHFLDKDRTNFDTKKWYFGIKKDVFEKAIKHFGNNVTAKPYPLVKDTLYAIKIEEYTGESFNKCGTCEITEYKPDLGCTVKHTRFYMLKEMHVEFYTQGTTPNRYKGPANTLKAFKDRMNELGICKASRESLKSTTHVTGDEKFEIVSCDEDSSCVVQTYTRRNSVGNFKGRYVPDQVIRLNYHRNADGRVKFSEPVQEESSCNSFSDEKIPLEDPITEAELPTLRDRSDKRMKPHLCRDKDLNDLKIKESSFKHNKVFKKFKKGTRKIIAKYIIKRIYKAVSKKGKYYDKCDIIRKKKNKKEKSKEEIITRRYRIKNGKVCFFRRTKGTE